MKGLSIQQPWAWCIIRPDIINTRERADAYASGLIKDIENRTRNTSVRGTIYVHASKQIDVPGLLHLRAKFPTIKWPKTFETGGLVGMVDIVDVVHAHASHWFNAECIGYVLANAKPIAFRAYGGKLGFFEVTPTQTEVIPLEEQV